MLGEPTFSCLEEEDNCMGIDNTTSMDVDSHRVEEKFGEAK